MGVREVYSVPPLHLIDHVEPVGEVPLCTYYLFLTSKGFLIGYL